MRPSVVIPNLNSPIVGRTVASVRAELPEAQVLVVGRDEPKALAGAAATLLVTEQVLNPAQARNHGAARANGDVLLFIDADCSALPGWAAAHLAAQTARAGLAGGAVTFDRQGFWATADNIASFHFLLPDSRDDRGLGSLNLSVDRAAFQRLGGFDESLPAGEDLDLALRARALGLPVVFLPTALVRHAPARTRLSDLWRHASGYGASFPRFLERHPEALGMGLAWSHPWLLRAAAPIKSVVAAAGIFAAHPGLWSSAHVLPGVAAFKLAYYLAAARAMTEGRRR